MKKSRPGFPGGIIGALPGRGTPPAPVEAPSPAAGETDPGEEVRRRNRRGTVLTGLSNAVAPGLRNILGG